VERNKEKLGDVIDEQKYQAMHGSEVNKAAGEPSKKRKRSGRTIELEKKRVVDIIHMFLSTDEDVNLRLQQDVLQLQKDVLEENKQGGDVYAQLNKRIDAVIEDENFFEQNPEVAFKAVAKCIKDALELDKKRSRVEFYGLSGPGAPQEVD
jgi:hypothetical protein